MTMLTEITFLSVFLAGLLGTTHCASMCSSIAGTLTLCLPAHIHQSPHRLWVYLLIYNCGRISSYIIAGILVGFLGAQFLQLLPLENPHLILKSISGLLMIALGLYLARWWQTLAFLETLGAFIWRRLEPFGRHFMPVKRPLHALGFGFIWGWLPCGLVYSALAFSLTAGSAWQGGLLMFAFGLGTLPIVLTLGMTVPWLKRIIHQPIVHQIIGTIIIGFGIFILIR